MAKVTERMKNHVSAAKEWLGRAEKSFEQENEIKGDLNLMLAQAELKRARETKRRMKGKFLYRSLLLHSILIAGFTGLAVVVGFSGFQTEQVKPEIPQAADHVKAVKTAQPAEDLMPAALPEEVAEETARKISPEETEPAQTALKKNVAQPETVRKQEELSVSHDQMRQLVRAAGKSLRGQE